MLNPVKLPSLWFRSQMRGRQSKKSSASRSSSNAALTVSSYAGILPAQIYFQDWPWTEQARPQSLPTQNGEAVKLVDGIFVATLSQHA